MKKKTNPSIKKQTGKRFRQFRESINKTQNQLAKELNVYQSTITNIEVGKTFPNIKYLVHFHETYNLNPTWLMTGQGDVFVRIEERISAAASLLPCHVPKKSPKYESYVELMEHMQVPEIEQIILAKLVELKVFAKDEIKKFQQRQKTKQKKA